MSEFPTLAEVAERHHKVDVYMPRVQTRCSCGQWYPGTHGQHIADKWRDACTITTVEQLDALPEESVIHVPHKPSASSVEKRHGQWWPNRSEGPFPYVRRSELLGALLLWHPEWSRP